MRNAETRLEFSPVKSGLEYVGRAMRKRGFEVADGANCVGGVRTSRTGRRHAIFVRITDPSEFDDLRIDLLHGYFVPYHQFVDRMICLVNDLKRTEQRKTIDERYAKRTLARFGWKSDLPEAVRQTALLEAVSVFSEERLSKVLRMLYNYWKVRADRRNLSRNVRDDFNWFRDNCYNPSSPFAKQKNEFIISLRSKAALEQNVAALLHKGHMRIHFDNFFLVKPAGQTVLG